MQSIVPGSVETGPSCQELPRGFLHSLRTLFDILDDGRRGSVHILEIESRWSQGSPGRALPPGVLQCLRRVAPASGYLTFDRFVQGLQSSLLSPGNRQAQESSNSVWKRSKNGSRRSSENPASLRTLKVSSQICPVTERHHLTSDKFRAPGVQPKSPLRARSANIPNNRTEPDHVSLDPGQCKTTLAEREPMMEQKGTNTGPQTAIECLGLEGQKRLEAEGRHIARCQSEASCGRMASGLEHRQERGELRRHTITNGIDYDRLKWMKELEQEKDALLQGLEVIDCARGWYIQQIWAIQERQKNLSKSPSGSANAAEGHSVRMDLLLSKLQAVRHCLVDLTSCSAKMMSRSCNMVNGCEFPAPCNIPISGNNLQMVTMLKEQNRLLTQEVSEKSDRITQLEQEKVALIKQLFTARSHSHHDSSQLDSTFI
ncbi:suppressor APC domain-containing protein 2 isoform X1 [Rhincodon typus]|uniref:suppressor APC domain-containing protein 2 isoform X1 n=1 Tax=Rhincodon typus TaxID=259920 RepID=UPI00202FFED5|nr:suppressor APC domain-containing protein 2 isoform X1 [Rhincodon typus]